MKTTFGTPLTKQEMKSINGGKLPGCATNGDRASAYTEGCCAGLYTCASTGNCWSPTTDAPGTCPCVGC